MSHPPRARGSRAAVLIRSVLIVAVLILAVLGAAGCSSQRAAPRASVESCVQFGISAIKRHVTVTSLPAACAGLTAAQVDAAAGTALRSAASGVPGKAERRHRIVQASRYLAHMFVALPTPRSEPPEPATTTHWVSRTTLSLLALGAWLVTVALGLSLLARRNPRGRTRRALAASLRAPAARLRLPALNRAHLGLAAASLLIWIVYLATGLTSIAWSAAGLLPLVAGLGMALVFLPGARDSVPAAPRDSAQARRPPVLIIGAHIAFATATILLAALAAIGPS